ncbi:hypothetical protein [Undibacterium sp. Di24W]|uniref:hypothetical protein n=1 Tax=Undibacterium sp. Di24W TaxID=3413033 RepID=UPI003BF14E91
METDPGKVLDEAREAACNKDYPIALDRYRWFYDNALRLNESYYGVRLSYCLMEWARLGQEFPPALEALISLKERTLSAFRASKSRRSFHEFASICQVLSCSEEAYQEFRVVSDKELSASLFRHVYRYCASNGMLDICREYLDNGYSQYREALELLDHMLNFSNEQAEGEARESLLHTGVVEFKREISWLLAMLRHAQALDEYESAMTVLESDLRERKLETVFLEIKGSA